MFAVGLTPAELVNAKPTGQLKPQLESSWTPTGNHVSWTVTLRPDHPR
jgi:hypothetical protein